MNKYRAPYDNEAAADFFSFGSCPKSAAHGTRFDPPAKKLKPVKSAKKSVMKQNHDSGR